MHVESVFWMLPETWLTAVHSDHLMEDIGEPPSPSVSLSLYTPHIRLSHLIPTSAHLSLQTLRTACFISSFLQLPKYLCEHEAAFPSSFCENTHIFWKCNCCWIPWTKIRWLHSNWIRLRAVCEQNRAARLWINWDFFFFFNGGCSSLTILKNKY